MTPAKATKPAAGSARELRGFAQASRLGRIEANNSPQESQSHGGSERIACTPTAADVLDELRLQFIAETASRAEHHSRIVASSASRRDGRLLAVKLRQLRACDAGMFITAHEFEGEQ